MNDVVQIAFGFGLFLLLSLLIFVIVLLTRFARKVEGLFLGIDRALVPFGQSDLGKLVHNAASTGRTYVDQPTDSLVLQLVALLTSISFVVKVAKAAQIDITPDRVALWGRAVFDALGALTDGVPADQVPKS